MEREKRQEQGTGEHRRRTDLVLSLMLEESNDGKGVRSIKEAWENLIDMLPLDSNEKKKLSSQNASFGSIIKHHTQTIENWDEAVFNKDKIDRLLSAWGQLPKREKLAALVRLFKRLDPILSSCKKKLEAIESTDNKMVLTNQIDLEALVAFGRRISCHVRAPPEYNDPTGVDGFCVPGYFFPCPDRSTISRSTLFHADLIRAVPPTITFKPDPRTRAMYWVDVQTPTPKPIIRYSINHTSTWNPYNSAQRPFITGPGYYTVRAYCQAEGFLVSEVTVADVDVPGPSTASDMEVLSKTVESIGIETKSESKQPTPRSAPVPIEVPDTVMAVSSVQSSVDSNLHVIEAEPTASKAPRTPLDQKLVHKSASQKFGGLFLATQSSSGEESDGDEMSDDSRSNKNNNNVDSEENDD